MKKEESVYEMLDVDWGEWHLEDLKRYMKEKEKEEIKREIKNRIERLSLQSPD